MIDVSTESVDTDLEEARRIALSVLAGRPARVYLFGSRAWGGASRRSDIDVGVLADRPLDPALMSALREAFEESRIPFHVDVVDLGTVDEQFRNKVVREGIEWHA